MHVRVTCIHFFFLLLRQRTQIRADSHYRSANAATAQRMPKLMPGVKTIAQVKMQLNYPVSVCDLEQQAPTSGNLPRFAQASARQSAASRPKAPSRARLKGQPAAPCTLPAVFITAEARPLSSALVVVSVRRRAPGNERTRRAFVHDGCADVVGHVERYARGLLPRIRSVSSQLSHVICTASTPGSMHALCARGKGNTTMEHNVLEAKGTQQGRKEQHGQGASRRARSRAPARTGRSSAKL